MFNFLAAAPRTRRAPDSWASAIFERLIQHTRKRKIMSSTVTTLVNQPYKYGFVTDIESDTIARGLSEDVVRLISAKKNEPEFMLKFRLKAYRKWLTMTEPTWPHVNYPAIDYQQIIYYSAPKQKPKKLNSLDEVDPTLLETFEKLGIPLSEQKRLGNVAVDAVFDSVSIATTFREKLAKDALFSVPSQKPSKIIPN